MNINNFYYAQVHLFDADKKLLNHSFHWKVCRLPAIGDLVIFKVKNPPNLLAVVENIAQVFDTESGLSDQHCIAARLLSEEEIEEIKKS